MRSCLGGFRNNSKTILALVIVDIGDNISYRLEKAVNCLTLLLAHTPGTVDDLS